jgi:hypothetical protein
MNTRGTQRIALVAMMITILIGSTIVKFDFRTPSNRLDDEIRLDSQHENASKIIEGWWSSTCCDTTELKIEESVSDAAGNMYITGSFEGQLQLGYTTLSSSGESLFVAKLDSRGQWKWAIQTLVVESSGLGIDHDPVNNILYVVGFFKNQSGSFSDSSGTLLPTFHSDSDDGNPSPNFLAVGLNSDNGTVESIWIPDVTDDPRGQFEDVHVNAYGVYATGVLMGNVSSAQNGGTGDMLVSSFNKTDLSLMWAVDNCVGNCTIAQEWGYYLSSDTNGDIFAAGLFIYAAMGFDFDNDSIQLANEGGYDIAIWKLSKDGTSINASGLASDFIDVLVGLEVVNDHVIVAGIFTGQGSLDSARSLYGSSLLISLELDLSTRWVSGIGLDAEGSEPSITSISSSLEGTVQVAGAIGNTVQLGNITVSTPPNENLLVAEMEPSSTGIEWTNGESISIPSASGDRSPLITSFDDDEVRIVSRVDSGLIDFAEGDYVVENDLNILVVAGFDWDRDADNVADAADNCPLLENELQADFDSDNEGDVCDEDDDNDGHADAAVNVTTEYSLTVSDTYGDGGHAVEVIDSSGATLCDIDAAGSWSNQTCTFALTSGTASVWVDSGPWPEEGRIIITTPGGTIGSNITWGNDTSHIVTTLTELSVTFVIAGDACATGAMSWTSSSSSDYDSDGCRDSDEDEDDDNDNVPDSNDDCQTGNRGWTSSGSTDYDSDGCQDSNEDPDDDNDGVNDLAPDDCPKGDLGWTSSDSLDYDSDGCRDSTEDPDDDNDGVNDNTPDNCQTGEMGWSASSSTDYDSDGCQDSSEDPDDDNDSVLDGNDNCTAPTSDLGWTASSSTDNDGDGCQDLVEDTDDDDDTIADSSDNCQFIANTNQDNHDSDVNGDACDSDDDDDGVLDVNEVSGCTDSDADNFDLNATDPGSCTYTNEAECDSCDQVNSNEDVEKTQLIDIIDDGEYSEEIIAAGGGTLGGLFIAKIYRWLKVRGKKIDARDINKLKNTYEIVKDEIEGETGGSVKDKQNYWESKHYFRPGLERQVAMTTSSDPDLDEYSE